MFNGCTALKESPYLPAETLVEYCYLNMFFDCSSLSRVSVNFTDFNTYNATTRWLSGMESFFWFRSDSMCGSTGDSSEIAVRKYNVRLVKEL